MQNAHEPTASSSQSQFHQRWHHLTNPHVRALAWLLDSPNLLDPDASLWLGKVATLENLSGYDRTSIHQWLTKLDREPTELMTAIQHQPFNRLGRYAEQLIAFYFRHVQILTGYGVQVQSDKNGTVGEFDFLLNDRDRLLHWEFATKFYLYESSCYVGPNLGDTLHAKMQKIMGQQLTLSQHSAALPYLDRPVESAQALVKGWLFYRDPGQVHHASLSAGVSSSHCRGYWCTFSEWRNRTDEWVISLPRLQWLAPAKVSMTEVLDHATMEQAMQVHFAQDRTPLLLAIMEQRGGDAIEINRGFIVADDWPSRAREQFQLG
jgi:hypothetical protein